MSFKSVLTAVVAGVALAGAVACTPTRSQRAPGEQFDDAALLGSVKTALVADSVTKAHQIEVDVHRGIVQLNGFVDSAREKSQATVVATRIEGVKKVQNNLSVRGESQSPGEYLDDATVTAKVKAALIKSRETKAHQINVETMNGVVHLSGFVNNEAARSAAATIARSVSGVKDVRNNLSVKTS